MNIKSRKWGYQPLVRLVCNFKNMQSALFSINVWDYIGGDEHSKFFFEIKDLIQNLETHQGVDRFENIIDGV